jgi:hypothetical protein
MTKRKKFLVTHDRPEVGLTQGEVVYEFWGNVYGGVRDDEALLGEPCEAVTRDPNGKNPFIICRSSSLQEQ